MKGKKMMLGIYLVAAVVLLFVVFLATSFVVTDILELREIATDVVYITNIKIQLIAQISSFVLIFIAFFINTLIVRRVMLRKGSALKFVRSYKKMTLLNLVITFVASIFVSKKVYTLFLLFKNSRSFGGVDPVFGQDIGYYIFQRPFLSAAFESAVVIWFMLILYTAILYLLLYIQKDITSFKNILHEKEILTHNIVNIIIYFIINIATYKFKREELLFGSFSNLAGAGFTELSVWLNYYRIMPYLIIAVVGFVIYFLLKGRRIKASLITISIIPAFWLLATGTALAVQIMLVKPYEFSMQTPYIERNIEATRKAFGIDGIYEKEFPAENNLSLSDVHDNADTINNIRITDVSATLTAANSMQSLRNFYVFGDNDIIAYDIGGKKTAVSVAAREFDKSKLQDSAKSYVNQHLRYTHGYGVVMNPVNKITEEGQPEFIIKDIPTTSYGGAPEITQPRIYFGEYTDDYVIVNSTYKELDYIEGDQNVEYTYEGKAGIPLNPVTRLMFSAKKADVTLLLSGYLTEQSRILTHRNIIDRAKTVAPFLEYDEDPYLVIDAEGKLKWVIDAYVSSKYYPYAQMYAGTNYIRNSAKVVIDAYDGTTKFYITDRTEPMILAYASMYPGLFEEGALPADINEHVRYSERLFKIQAEVYKRYHMSLTEVFYSNSDLWTTAKEKHTGGEPVDVEPYYNLMTIDPERGEELALVLPYTPHGKENLVAWMAATVSESGENRIYIYKFPKGKTVYGTLHIENKIDNDPNISREISLWDQGGSTVFKGNLLVVPIKDSLLYVEPIYITTKNSAAIPEVKRVVIVYNETVVMEATLDRALEVLFGNQKPSYENKEKTLEETVRSAILKYNELKGYSATNDFGEFGKALDELGDTISELDEKVNKKDSNNNAEVENIGN